MNFLTINVPHMKEAQMGPYTFLAGYLPIGLWVVFLLVVALSLMGCHDQTAVGTSGKSATDSKIRVVLDTDANNEIDDQHAMAYLFFSGDVFDLEGVTVNATSGGGIDLEYAEARRVMQLTNLYGEIPLHKGADGSFNEIKDQVDAPEFDGSDAVNFIIEQAMAEGKERLVLLPVGKLTNIALALKKEPAIASRVRVVWLGSNYPDSGEHNQNWDPASLNFILEIDVPFEVVTVRGGESSGTAAVRATLGQIQHRMPGVGPEASEPVTGRHGGTFHNFGDYSVNLFENYDMGGQPPSRPLFDMAAVAILKDPSWAEAREIPAPRLDEEGLENPSYSQANEMAWTDRPDNQRTITLWEHFDIYGIMNDFFETMEEPILVDAKE